MLFVARLVALLASLSRWPSTRDAATCCDVNNTTVDDDDDDNDDDDDDDDDDAVVAGLEVDAADTAFVVFVAVGDGVAKPRALSLSIGVACTCVACCDQVIEEPLAAMARLRQRDLR